MRFMELLGLSEDELCQALGADALTVLSGEAEALPQLAILVGLLEPVAAEVGKPVLRRWVRRSTPWGRPLELLAAREYVAFEGALADLQRRGLVLRAGPPVAGESQRDQ